MSTSSLRLKLTLAFALAMAVVLAAMSLFVYLRVGGALIASVDHNLRAQAAETEAHLGDGRRPLVDPDTAGGPMLAQLLDRSGHRVRSDPAGLPPLLSRPRAALVAAGSQLLRSGDVPGRSHDWRLLAVPVGFGGRGLVLVLAGSLAARSDALHRLFVELLVAGPIALLLASLAGYALAAGALRPVESMRRRAAAISASTPGSRLPVPAGRDEIARLASTLNEMLARLETAFEHERAAIEHERRFVADASHELRTPLALLQTELDVALRRPRPRGELEAALRSAAEETQRLNRLAADLLLIARSDKGQLPLHREPVPAAALLHAAADRFAARAREEGRAVVVPAAPAALLVDADAAYVEQALGSLIDNALNHGAGPIELSALRRGRLVELHVADRGPGLPSAFLPRAFDRFSRADEARSRGGTGLGLSIVDLIARAHGGEAGAGNRPGGGADIWIGLEPATPGPTGSTAARAVAAGR
jgi:two-component system OmpR family sensor kinase